MPSNNKPHEAKAKIREEAITDVLTTNGTVMPAHTS
jgi:hypothetical protein